MVFKNINNCLWFIDRLATISPKVQMLHSNIFGTIEKMWSRVDIEDEKKQNNTFEKVVGLETPMLLDEGTVVVHIG